MNPVFQPGNLAIRNAWFSGGVEWNMGIRGHSVYTCSPVFAARVHMVNTKARILHVNGITGQGSFELSTVWTEGEETVTVEGKRLRFSMPAALCSYCLGETRIGSDFQMGNVRKMDLELPTGKKTDGGPQDFAPEGDRT